MRAKRHSARVPGDDNMKVRMLGREYDNSGMECLQCEEFRAQVRALREALEKYADRKHYDGRPSAIDMDDGEVARAALATPPASQPKEEA